MIIIAERFLHCQKRQKVYFYKWFVLVVIIIEWHLIYRTQKNTTKKLIDILFNNIQWSSKWSKSTNYSHYNQLLTMFIVEKISVNPPINIQWSIDSKGWVGSWKKQKIRKCVCFRIPTANCSIPPLAKKYPWLKSIYSQKVNYRFLVLLWK